MAAPMISSRIKPRKEYPRVENIAVGEECYLNFPSVVVDAKDNTTYLEKRASTVAASPLFTVIVRRDHEGYHVILHEPYVRFEPKIVKDYTELVPVSSVREELDPTNPFNNPL
jgi:hypothetical protein